MKTRTEILEETQKFLEQIDPHIFRLFMKYLDAISYGEISKLPLPEYKAALGNIPMQTITSLATLLKDSNYAKSCAHGHLEDRT